MAVTFELRQQDYSLTDDQKDLRRAFSDYFAHAVGSARVRAAEPLGHDFTLWQELHHAQQVVAMGLPEAFGGAGAGLVDLALVVEEAGRRAAPVPLVDAIVAARALARLAPTTELFGRARDSSAIATVAPGLGGSGPRLVPAGAVAEAVIALHGDDVVLVTGPPAPLVPNMGYLPIAWWDLSDHACDVSVIGCAVDFASVENEWRLLTAAALVGLGQAALDLGVRYATERSAFGTAIGSFQAIAHPLVDAVSAVESARRLLWRAAWHADDEPSSSGHLGTSALLAAASAAERAGAVAIHTQGGFGVTLESDVQLYYRRAKGLALLAGDRRTLLRDVADQLLGPTPEGVLR